MACLSSHRILSCTFGAYSLVEAFAATIQETLDMWTPLKTGAFVTNRCMAIQDYDLNATVEYIALANPIPKMEFADLVTTVVPTSGNGTITLPNMLALDAGLSLNNQTNSESAKFRYLDETGIEVDPIIVSA